MIRNIIFDFGDVFINLDKPATPKAMAAFGYTNTTPELQKIFDAYEKGAMTSELFLEKTRTLFPDAGEEQMRNAWNAMLLDFPEERLAFLERLAAEKKYRLFLLSNTNDIHIEHEKKVMGENFTRFKNCFERFYLSYEMGMRKPESEIFGHVLKENGLVAEETLFIDDTFENIEAAKEMGIKTWHLQVGNEDIIELENRL